MESGDCQRVGHLRLLLSTSLLTLLVLWAHHSLKQLLLSPLPVLSLLLMYRWNGFGWEPARAGSRAEFGFGWFGSVGICIRLSHNFGSRAEPKSAGSAGSAAMFADRLHSIVYYDTHFINNYLQCNFYFKGCTIVSHHPCNQYTVGWAMSQRPQPTKGNGCSSLSSILITTQIVTDSMIPIEIFVIPWDSRGEFTFECE